MWISATNAAVNSWDVQSVLKEETQTKKDELINKIVRCPTKYFTIAHIIPVTASEYEFRMAHRETWVQQAQTIKTKETKAFNFHLYFAVGVSPSKHIQSALESEIEKFNDIIQLPNNEVRVGFIGLG
jgi:hypothetical protein